MVKKLFFSALAALLLLWTVSCQRPSTAGVTGISAEKKAYLADLDKMIVSLERLQSKSRQGKITLTDLWEVRQRFAAIEFMLEFYDGDRHRLFNGAPVLKEDHSQPSAGVIYPAGFQAMEAALCEGADGSLLGLIDDLVYQSKLYSEAIKDLTPSAADWSDALRMHLIRMETLQMAGFDQVCRERRSLLLLASLSTVEKHLLLSGSKAAVQTGPVIQRGKLLLQQAADEIPIADTFIREVIQPLRELMQALPSNGRQPEWRSFNINAVSLYEEDFLNAGYFSSGGIPKGDNRLREDLGRQLFYEPALSASGTMSCATCHIPERFFTDGMKVSKGRTGTGSGRRNTPTLINAAYQSSYMYDGRASSLEDQMIHVFLNETEFHQPLLKVVESIARNEAYTSSFRSAYPEWNGAPVTLFTITDALAAYLRSLTSHQSPFDRYMRHGAELNVDVRMGFNLFMGKAACGTCHFPPEFNGLAPPYFTESEFEHIGVPGGQAAAWQVDEDQGRYSVFPHPAFRHYFKTPTLRNVHATGPYFHNGIMSTLEEVVDFYDRGGGVGSGIPYTHQTLPADSLGLSAMESAQLIAFLRSLADSSLLSY